MGRNKESVDLILAKGRSHHLTKQDIEDRKSQEVPVIADNIRPPGFLTTKKQRTKFSEIAKALTEMKIMGNADCDMLGRYIICQEDWERYGKLGRKISAGIEKLVAESLETGAGDEEDAIEKKIKKATAHLSEYERLRSEAFKKCQECAQLLGMTITSRGKITIPKKEEKPKDNKFDRFIKGGAG